MNFVGRWGTSIAIAASVCLAGCSGSRMPPGAAVQERPTGFPDLCSPEEVEVMLLGTYHFAGASNDAVDSPLDDVLSPRRQQELDELTERLARWSPDQIAVEWPYSMADTATARYRRYLAAGTSSLGEIEQLAFRLGKRLEHPTVYPIDHRMGIGNDSIQPLAERRPDLRERAERLIAELQSSADSVRVWMSGTTITEHLYAGNTEEALRGGNSRSMFGSYLAAGEGSNVAGPELLARWYERNILMAHNLTRVLQPSTRRVLVLVGSGHVPPLRNILHESPDFCPVSPLSLLQ